MWILRQYRRTDDELALEVVLPELQIEALEEAIGRAPVAHGSNPVEPDHVRALSTRFGFSPIAPELVESFLDFDDDHDPPEVKAADRSTAANR